MYVCQGVSIYTEVTLVHFVLKVVKENSRTVIYAGGRSKDCAFQYLVSWKYASCDKKKLQNIMMLRFKMHSYYFRPSPLTNCRNLFCPGAYVEM